MQTKVYSFIESCVNILIGFIIALAAQAFIFPIFDIHVSFSTDIKIAAFFTVASLIRSYCVRRLFNAIHLKVPYGEKA